MTPSPSRWPKLGEAVEDVQSSYPLPQLPATPSCHQLDVVSEVRWEGLTLRGFLSALPLSRKNCHTRREAPRTVWPM